MKPISIAIDGPSGAGKSTIARKGQRRGHCHAAGAAH